MLDIDPKILILISALFLSILNTFFIAPQNFNRENKTFKNCSQTGFFFNFKQVDFFILFVDSILVFFFLFELILSKMD
jgi:hypothetical protein